MFGVGTAAVVCPIKDLHYQGDVIKMPEIKFEDSLTNRFFVALSDIQYGNVQFRDWTVPVGV